MGVVVVEEEDQMDRIQMKEGEEGEVHYWRLVAEGEEEEEEGQYHLRMREERVP
jgi:hypothetical protein